MSRIRKLCVAAVKARFISGLVASVVGLMAVVGAPHAAFAAGQSPYVKKGSSLCIFANNSADRTALKLGGCGLIGTGVRQNSGTFGGHPAIKVYWDFGYAWLCIDSLGQTSGAVRDHICNTGNYQVFEVFNGSVAGTKVLKSVGAYVHQGVHICMSSGGASGSAITWVACNTRSTLQQFNWNP